MTTQDRYAAAALVADALEAELKRLRWWTVQAPPPAAFEDMGAFGQGTLGFAQWIQFVLVSRIREIASERGEFPSGSEVGAYAVRELDGAPDADRLIQLLHKVDALAVSAPTLDDLVETGIEAPAPADDDTPVPPAETVQLGDTRLPAVLYTLIGVLPQFEGEALEDQLETYDTFLAILSPVVRPELSALLLKAAAGTADPASRARIERAAHAVARGGRAAER